jgi:hypothetical protein
VDIFDRFLALPWGVWAGVTLGLAMLFIAHQRWQERQERLLAEAEGRPIRPTRRKRSKSDEEPARGEKILLTDDEAANRAVSGRLLSCTLDAAVIQAADELERGTILSWKPFTAPPNYSWAVVEVKGAKKDGRYWQLTCRFVRTPPWVTRYLAKTLVDADHPLPVE